MSKLGQSPLVPLLAATVLVLASVCGGQEAFAQSRELETMRAQVERLQREIQDLQRQTYRPGAAPRAAAPTAGTATAVRAGPPAPALTGAAQARIDQRLTELETELRALRGSMERVSFQANRLSTRVDKLVTDVDFRLRALESRTAAVPPLALPQVTLPMVTPGTGPPPASAPPHAGIAPMPPPISRQAIGGPGMGSGGGVLGQLPSSVLEGEGTIVPETADTTAAPTETVSPVAAGAGAQVDPGVAAPTRQATMLPPSAPAMPATSPEDAYRKAYSLLKRADFAGAEQSFRGFLETFPDHGLTENARYWLGETYYVRKNYRQAAIAFADGYKQHPKGIKASDNLLKLAKSFGGLEQKENACATLKRLRQEFPKARPAIRERAEEAVRNYVCK